MSIFSVGIAPSRRRRAVDADDVRAPASISRWMR
jgi:hypothetical protein